MAMSYDREGLVLAEIHDGFTWTKLAVEYHR